MSVVPAAKEPPSTWVHIRNVPNGAGWQSGVVCVISTLDHAELPDGSGDGPQWHVSISRVTPSGNRRPKPAQVRHALRAFGMTSSELDNHEPGNAEHYWLPVDPAHRVDCECKSAETLVVEPDGHRWSNAKDGPCRGCQFRELTGKPCPLHPRGEELGEG